MSFIIDPDLDPNLQALNSDAESEPPVRIHNDSSCDFFAFRGTILGTGTVRIMYNCLNVQEFPGVDQIKLEASDLCAVKLDPDLGVEYETVEDVSLEDAANVYFRQPLRM